MPKGLNRALSTYASSPINFGYFGVKQLIVIKQASNSLVTLVAILISIGNNLLCKHNQ